MQFDGAVVKEQGQTFGIVLVKQQVLIDQAAQRETQQFGKRAFGAMPIVLMAQDSRGVPTYVGRKDIVNFLAGIDYARIPWQTYTLT